MSEPIIDLSNAPYILASFRSVRDEAFDIVIAELRREREWLTFTIAMIERQAADRSPPPEEKQVADALKVKP